MTPRELSLRDHNVYINETYGEIDSFAISSSLFNFTEEHDGSHIYNIDLEIYNVSMSNSMLYYRNNEQYWSIPLDPNLLRNLRHSIFEYFFLSCSKDPLFHGYDYIGTTDGWSVKHAEPIDIPKDKLYNYSVAVKIINRTMYPTYSPSSSGGISGIIQH